MAIGTEYEINVDQQTAIFRSTTRSGEVAEYAYDGSLMIPALPEVVASDASAIARLLEENKRFRAWQRLVREQLVSVVEPRPLYSTSWDSRGDWIQHSFGVRGVRLTGAEWGRQRGVRLEERPKMRVTWAVAEAWSAALARFFNTALLASCEKSGLGDVIDDVASLVI